MRGKLQFILTQRPLLKIISTIRQKIIQRIGREIGPQYEQDISDALAAGGDIDRKLLDMVVDNQIDLVGADNTPLLKQQMSSLTNE